MAVSKDTLKTIGGLVVIALIIVGAFLYGDAQHQSQVRQHQNTKAQASTSSQAKGSSQAQAPAKPASSPTPSQAPAGQVGQGGVSQTPQTGAADELLPLAALAVVLVVYRYSLPKRSAR